MRITLETFRLLNPKIGQLERSTGGTPDLTYQEVADVLSGCTKPTSNYARYSYALDDTLRFKIVDAVTRRLLREDQARNRPILPNQQHWKAVAELGVRLSRSTVYLTASQKRIVTDLPRWTTRHEEALQNVRSLLDEWDYELRCELGAWNRRLEDTTHG